MLASNTARLLKDIGRRISELRAARGLTQDRLAERRGVSLKYLQRVEAGRENLTVESLARIARVLGAPVGEFFRAPRSRSVRRGRPKTAARQ